MSAQTSRREALVYADWEGLSQPNLMGILKAELLRGKEIFSFSYDPRWLASGFAQELDPDLAFYSGPQYLNDQKPNFGLFLDSSPDRWGRVLMRKREAAMARKEGRKELHLFEMDYLLGVYDGHRMGALRFKQDLDGPFLNDNKEMASPPWASLRSLEEISLKLEDEKSVDDPEYLQWLHQLIAPGSSLGGARPKASVVDANGHLWIAKFPSLHDHSDVGAWEWVTYELARAAGIQMATCMAKAFSIQHHTFLTRRFDRTAQGNRLHFASAMTLLGHVDGQDHREGASYLELVEFITTQGARVEADLAELWRRIVFSICVSNTDDHLRNHGFILTPIGWVLSPAFDINPVETGTGLSLNISEHDNALDLSLAMSVKDYFRLSETQANQIIKEVIQAVSRWRSVARKIGLSPAEMDLKARAFHQATES